MRNCIWLNPRRRKKNREFSHFENNRDKASKTWTPSSFLTCSLSRLASICHTVEGARCEFLCLACQNFELRGYYTPLPTQSELAPSPRHRHSVTLSPLSVVTKRTEQNDFKRRKENGRTRPALQLKSETSMHFRGRPCRELREKDRVSAFNREEREEINRTFLISDFREVSSLDFSGDTVERSTQSIL